MRTIHHWLRWSLELFKALWLGLDSTQSSLTHCYHQFAYHLQGMQMTVNLLLTLRYTALLRYKQKSTRLCSGQMLTILLSVLISAVFYNVASNQIKTYTTLKEQYSFLLITLKILVLLALQLLVMLATIRLITSRLSKKPLKFQSQLGVYFGQGQKNYSGWHSKYM